MAFEKLQGLHYPRFLKRLHQQYHFDWYLEIGCRDGRSAAHSRGKSIMVDPYFVTERNVIGAKPALFCFQQTSDAFFASDMLSKLDVQISLAFLDGMHLFEFLLRDILNTEANATSDSVIMLHDCYPQNEEMTTRDHESLNKSAAWAGDVWKVLPILRAYRPEMEITVLDCTPTGIVVLSNLEPRSTVLKDNYDKIVAEYKEIKIADFGVERFADEFPLEPAVEWLTTSPLLKRISLAEKSFSEPEYVSP